VALLALIGGTVSYITGKCSWRQQSSRVRRAAHTRCGRRDVVLRVHDLLGGLAVWLQRRLREWRVCVVGSSREPGRQCCRRRGRTAIGRMIAAMAVRSLV